MLDANGWPVSLVKMPVHSGGTVKVIIKSCGLREQGRRRTLGVRELPIAATRAAERIVIYKLTTDGIEEKVPEITQSLGEVPGKKHVG